MAIEWNRFWCRVLFKEYIKHYRKMTDEQIVRDVRQSMDDLEDLVADTDSFGSQMVRWSNERSEEPFATAARENGKKGGRPRKNQETTADATTREDVVNESDGISAVDLESSTSANISVNDGCSRQNQRGGEGSLRLGGHVTPSRTLPLPTWESFLSFVDGEGLDYSDAREWWEMTMVDRKGLDRYGKPIGNWKGALKRFCKSKTERRSA